MLINKSRTKKIMEKYGLEALIATTPENVAYLTGFWIVSFLGHRPRQTLAIISKDEMLPDLIISKGLMDHPLMGETWVRQYYIYGDFHFETKDSDDLDHESEKMITMINNLHGHNTVIDAVINCLADRGISNTAIGIDQGSDIYFLSDTLKQSLPNIKIEPAYNIFREIRMVKTLQEINRIKSAVSLDEQALKNAIKSINLGVTEKEISQVFKETVIRENGLPTLVSIGSGHRSAFPNVEPSYRHIEKNDIIRFDVGCMLNSYHADIARTVSFGKPNKKIKKYHDALMAGQSKILTALKPGVTTSYLFDLGVETVRKNGIPHYKRQHCGHGNGIEGYDLPTISPEDQTQLEPGMVLCVETPYYEIGMGGLQIEDVAVITEDGFDFISEMERKLFQI